MVNFKKAGKWMFIPQIIWKIIGLGTSSLGLPSKNIVLHAEFPIFGYVFCPSLCLGDVVLTIWQSNVASREIAQR